MGDEATRREYFKVRFVVDDIATGFTNKYGGTASDLYRRRARGKREIGVIEPSGRRST